jgi:hypothetical protein
MCAGFSSLRDCARRGASDCDWLDQVAAAVAGRRGAILNHYRRPDGKQNIEAAAHDLARWPPIATRQVEKMRRLLKAELARQQQAGLL